MVNGSKDPGKTAILILSSDIKQVIGFPNLIIYNQIKKPIYINKPVDLPSILP
jgi:hypothetical protein